MHIPIDRYIIDVRDCRAVVSHLVSDELGWYYDPVPNWRDIEGDAIDAIERMGGAVNISGIYPCPDWLQEKVSVGPAE